MTPSPQRHPRGRPRIYPPGGSNRIHAVWQPGDVFHRYVDDLSKGTSDRFGERSKVDEFSGGDDLADAIGAGDVREILDGVVDAGCAGSDELVETGRLDADLYQS